MKRLAALLLFLTVPAFAAAPQDARLVDYFPATLQNGSWWTGLRVSTIGCPDSGSWAASITIRQTRNGAIINERTDSYAYAVPSYGSYGCPPWIGPDTAPNCHFNCVVTVDGHAATGPCIAVPDHDYIQLIRCECTTEFAPWPDPEVGPVMEWVTQPGDHISAVLTMASEWGTDSDTTNNTITMVVP